MIIHIKQLETSQFLAKLDSDFIFEGGSFQCERFIRWVRNSARDQGKGRDNDWMVDLAAGALGGDALIWYSELDVEISDDWRALQRALLARYVTSGNLAHR